MCFEHLINITAKILFDVKFMFITFKSCERSLWRRKCIIPVLKPFWTIPSMLKVNQVAAYQCFLNTHTNVFEETWCFCQPMQSSHRNRSPATDLVFLKLTFHGVFLSAGMFFCTDTGIIIMYHHFHYIDWGYCMYHGFCFYCCYRTIAFIIVRHG